MKLTKIAELELAGDSYHLARNGHFKLVEKAAEDVYGTVSYKEVPYKDFDPELIDAILDALGEKIVQLQSARDMRRDPE